jgi:hypothetical protein
MKKLITGFLIATSIISYSQTKEFSLSKSVTVGCYNANPLTDMTKKIEVSIQNNEATFTIASLNCKKEFTAQSLGELIPGSTAYYDSKEKKGIILEGNDKIAIFTEKEGSFEVGAIGHTDKKVAKTLSLEESQGKYKDSFNNVDKLLAQAKADAELAKKAANTLPIPEGNYTDKFGISGKHYLSEPSEVVQYAGEKGDTKYAVGVQLEYDEKERILKIHYADGKFDKAFLDGSTMNKAVSEGVITNILLFKGDHMNRITCFKNTTIIKLEDGTWLLETGSRFYRKLDCSGIEFQSSKDKAGNPIIKYAILSKDKNRGLDLAKNTEEVITLGEESTLKNCEQGNALEAAKRPMPAPGLKDSKLNTEATKVVQNYAAGKWAQSVDYVYIIGTEWFTIRNKNTGIITGRAIRAVAVLKTTAGKCQWEEVSIKQDYDGANYGKSYFGGNTQIIVPIECSQAMKYK